MVMIVVIVMVVRIVLQHRMPVFAPAKVRVGTSTVVVAAKAPLAATAAAVASAPVAVGLNCGDIEAQGRQDNHPGHQGDELSAFLRVHVLLPIDAYEYRPNRASLNPERCPLSL